MGTEEASLNLDHQGFVHDICLDYYGRRMATCSEDGSIKIYARSRHEEGWHQVCTLPYLHKMGVMKLCWSHPEFSMLLASAGVDQSIVVWEEEENNRWKMLLYYREFTVPVTDVQFAPKHLGLELAVSLNNGKVSVITSSDQLRRNWSVTNEFSFELPEEEYASEDDASLDASCLSWNSFPYDPPSMVVGSLKGQAAVIFRADHERNRYHQVTHIPMTHASGVNHVAWAPNLGRSFHLIATASSDGTAKIWNIRKGRSSGGQDGVVGDGVLGNGDVEVKLVQTLKHAPSSDKKTPEVFRVEWNLTASLLSTSTDDGIVRIWGPNLKGDWVEQTQLVNTD